jgi:hypothetical protein
MLTESISELGSIFWEIFSWIIINIWTIAPVGVGVATAIAAWLSARAVKKVSQARLYFEYLQKYSSDEMLRDLKLLGELQKKRYDRKYGQKWFEKWAKTRLQSPEKPSNAKNSQRRTNIDIDYAIRVDEARRRVSSFFLTALMLYANEKCISRRSFTAICGLSGFEIVFFIVEHLELAIANQEAGKFRRDKYDDLLGLSGREMDDIDRFEI